MSIENTLAERGNRYGDFTDHARLCQDLKAVMTAFAVVQNTPNGVSVHFPWGDLPATHKQSLEVIADKIARILSGDPNYADNWHDIQGYAKLVEDRLPKPEEPAAAIDDDSPRQQAVAQNGNTGEHYGVVDPADVDISDGVSPSWDDAPTWANWLAQDYECGWFWFEHPIYADEGGSAWYEQDAFNGRIAGAREASGRNPHWRDTRQARPTK